MTSTEREKIIALAKSYSYSFGESSASLTFANIIDIWEQAQSEAYEKAAEIADSNCEDEPYGHAKFRCVNIATAIRKLKEQS